MRSIVLFVVFFMASESLARELKCWAIGNLNKNEELQIFSTQFGKNGLNPNQAEIEDYLWPAYNPMSGGPERKGRVRFVAKANLGGLTQISIVNLSEPRGIMRYPLVSILYTPNGGKSNVMDSGEIYLSGSGAVSTLKCKVEL